MDTQIAELPSLAPLARSYAADDVEDELKQLFINIFSSMVALDAFDANASGMAQIASLEYLRRAINADGLVMLPDTATEDDVTRWIYKAWKAQNQGGRGFHFLATYLQAISPNAWTIDQMMQSKAVAYPENLFPSTGHEFDEDKYLTSRVNIGIGSSVQTADSIAAIAKIIRGILPARIVPFLSLTTAGATSMYEGGVITAVKTFVSHGTVLPP